MARLSLPALAQLPAEAHHSGIREIGNEALRTKIAGKLHRVNGIVATPDRIACSPGGVGALAAVFGAVLENGDEVLMPDPGWPNTRLMLTWVGAKGVFYPCPEADGFQPDID